jgi:hypothetical protein
MVTRPPAAFDDELLDAALLSVLGEPTASAGDADGHAAPSPRGVARSLARSRRASTTLGLAAVGAIAGLAFLTLARDDAPDAPRGRAAAPSQRADATSVRRPPVNIAPVPVAPTTVAATPATRPSSITRPTPLPTVPVRVARPFDRPADAEQVSRRPAVVLTSRMIGAVEPAAIAISAPAAPQPEPIASMVIDPAPPAEATALSATTQRARRDSVVAIRSFRRQW